MYIDFPEVKLDTEGIEDVILPKMVTIRQLFSKTHITDISGSIKDKMTAKIQNKEQFKDKSICLTVGSRGIPHLDIMVQTMCDTLKSWGAKPFIVPSMGSHGGATAEGQLAILQGYNITEELCGVPIISSMDVEQYGQLSDGTPLFCDRNAWESDGVVVFNKVKPHTDFRGKHESGLAKMIAIGLAKHKGASILHMKGFPCFAEVIPQIAEIFLEKKPLTFGVGVVQNAYDEICTIEVAENQDFIATDRTLQELSKQKMPSFKFTNCDVLIVDEIGKNISGCGHDPNITGRTYEEGFTVNFKVTNLFIRGLTKESHHNGIGLHIADITTRRCLNDVNWRETWLNTITSNRLNGGRIPLYENTDYDALRLAIRTCDDIDFSKAHVARIKNTLAMGLIQVSEALYEDIKNQEDVSYVSGPNDIEFDAQGFMLPF
jgi:hypothetical protein